ncbi:MAG: NUDIX hydrolase [Nanoarchaeota archaeon]
MISKKSLIIFIDDSGNVLIQDRRKIKKLGKPYGFFGGSIEIGESPKEAIIREVKEELSIDLKNFRLFKNINEENLEWYLYIADMPNLNEIDVKEGAEVFIPIEKALHLDISDRDKQMLALVKTEHLKTNF